MEQRIEVYFTVEFLMTSTWTMWRRRYGLPYLSYIGVPLMAAVIGFTDKEFRSSIAGALLLGILFGISGTFMGLFFRGLQDTRKAIATAARKYENLKVTYIFNESGVSFESDEISSTASWRRVKKIWQCPKVWFVYVGDEQYFAIPPADLGAELKQNIIDWLLAAGGKVIG